MEPLKKRNKENEETVTVTHPPKPTNTLVQARRKHTVDIAKDTCGLVARLRNKFLAQERNDRFKAIASADSKDFLPQLRGGADGVKTDGNFMYKGGGRLVS